MAKSCLVRFLAVIGGDRWLSVVIAGDCRCGRCGTGCSNGYSTGSRKYWAPSGD